MLTHTRKGSGRAVIFKRLESQCAQSYIHHAIQLDEGEPWQAAIELLMQADPDHWELYETDNPDAATFLNLCKDAFHEKKAAIAVAEQNRRWQERLKYAAGTPWKHGYATGMVLDPDAVEASIPHNWVVIGGGLDALSRDEARVVAMAIEQNDAAVEDTLYGWLDQEAA
jgi:hypothetical protein